MVPRLSQRRRARWRLAKAGNSGTGLSEEVASFVTTRTLGDAVRDGWNSSSSAARHRARASPR